MGLIYIFYRLALFLERRKNIYLIKQNSSLYPEELLNIFNAPKRIFCLGNIDLLKEKKISIVGCRDASVEGKQIAEYFGYKLAKLGYCIVSGMARGIDEYAHLGALKAKGKTIAVLGSGVNVIYPRQNRYLYTKIIENNGLIISENKPNHIPIPEDFPKRNRIISGLSFKLLVVEASIHSGSIITANLAAEQGREVYAVPRFNLK